MSSPLWKFAQKIQKACRETEKKEKLHQRSLCVKALCALQHLATLAAPCTPFGGAPRRAHLHAVALLPLKAAFAPRALTLVLGYYSPCALNRVLGLTKYGVLRNKLRKTRILYNSCRRRYSVQAVTNSYIVPWLALRARNARPPQLVQNARLVQRNKHSDVGFFAPSRKATKTAKRSFPRRPSKSLSFFFTQNSITFCIIAVLAKTAKKAPRPRLALCSYFFPTAARSRPSAPFARAKLAQRLGKKYLIIGFNSFLKCHA